MAAAGCAGADVLIGGAIGAAGITVWAGGAFQGGASAAFWAASGIREPGGKEILPESSPNALSCAVSMHATQSNDEIFIGTTSYGRAEPWVRRKSISQPSKLGPST